MENLLSLEITSSNGGVKTDIINVSQVETPVATADSVITEDSVEIEPTFSNLPQRILACEVESEIGESGETISDEGSELLKLKVLSNVDFSTFVENDHASLNDEQLIHDDDDQQHQQQQQQQQQEEPTEFSINNDKFSNNSPDSKELVGTSSNIQLPFSFPGQSFSEQAQKLILNVWDFFKRAKKDPQLIHGLRGPQDHASAALNVGTKTIGKIAKRVLRLGKLETPGKKRNRPKTVLDSIGPEGEEVLRTIIREMYERRVAPTISLVLAEAKERLDFKGSTTSLRRILKRMGFKYGGITNSLIQSDKPNVSGWKEKSSKKSWRPSKSSPMKRNERKRTKVAQDVTCIENHHQSKPELQQPPVAVEEPSEAIIGSDSEMIESHEIIQSQEVIIHYQQKSSNENDFLSQARANQIITVTGTPSDLIQLQIDPNGQTVVQEWQWQQLQKIEDCSNDTILGVQSL